MVFCFVLCCLVNCNLIGCTGLLDKKRMIILTCLLVAAVFCSGNTIPHKNFVQSCRNVSLVQCAQYNHSTYAVDNVQDAFRDVEPLFSSGCSNYIRELVCFMLEPTCHGHTFYDNGSDMSVTFNFKVLVCKEFCETVKQECDRHGPFWISALNCSSLPSKPLMDSDETCLIPPEYTNNTNNTNTRTSDNITPTPTIQGMGKTTASTTTARGTTTASTTTVRSTTTASTTARSTITTPITTPTTNPITDKSNASEAPVTVCPGRLVPYQGASYGNVDNCAAPCHYLYEEDQLSSGLVTFLFVLWTILSSLAVVSFISFLLTWKHYSHIERPYHFLALCHALMLFAFLIRLCSGHDAMVCDTRHRTINDTALVKEDLGNASCTVVFIIVYYSIMAISMWLVNLSIALCTRTMSKWKGYLFVGYHLSGWGIPLIFVIAVCAQRLASGDSLLGMCQVDSEYLLVIFIPIMVCVGLSFILMLLVIMQMLFCSQTCVESVQHKHPGRFLRSLMFGVIVLIEISIIAILYLVEYVTYEHWQLYYTDCVEPSSQKAAVDCPTRTFTKPSYAIPIIRYSLISLVGAVSIVWPLVRKVTWKSWKDSASLLYRKIVNSFRYFRRCSWRNKSAVIVQLVS